VAVAISVMNVMTYGFTAAVARQVTPSEFGALTALMGLLLVGSVAALGLQASTARRLATCDRSQLGVVVGCARRATYVIGAAASLLVLFVSPLLVRVLALDHWLPLAVAAGTLLPLTVFGAQAGVAQGTAQWGRLAGLYVAVGAGRIVCGTAGAAVWPTASGTMLGVLVGALVPVVLGWRLIHPRGSAATGTSSVRGLVVETLAGSQALLAFFAVTNADALLARVVLTPQSSGLYAAGLIVAKAALFLPQFVAVVAFPSLARDDHPATRRTAVLVVSALGALAVAGTWLLPALALVFAGGERYAEIRDLLPLFAAEGATFALVNLFVYDSLAERSGRVAPVLWCALMAITLTTILFVDSIVALTCTMIVGGLTIGGAQLLLRSRAPVGRA
jgi:O-antigen/teichoic acid export membrane protein